MPKPLDLAWLAGLVEGEGSFFVAVHTDKRWKKVHQYRRPTVNINMTDEDVVRRAKEVAGVGSVGGPFERKGGKPQWFWRVQKKEEALWLMKQLYPFMGLRRQQKIDEILREFEGVDLAEAA